MSIYEVPIRGLGGEPERVLDEVKGKATLVVNVASRCGFTPQYEGLQRLHDTYGSRGFSVVGVPCNQFLEQEPGTEEEIRTFCSTTYGVTFPLTEKIEVNGEERHPLYEQLTPCADAEGNAGDVGWNFEKFLVDRDGVPVTRFRTGVEPESEELVSAIEELLGA